MSASQYFVIKSQHKRVYITDHLTRPHTVTHTLYHLLCKNKTKIRRGFPSHADTHTHTQRERERERERDRQTDREREGERETDRERELSPYGQTMDTSPRHADATTSGFCPGETTQLCLDARA